MVYLANIVLSAIMAGFMVSYTITLGGYFSYMVKMARLRELQATYAPFRAVTHAKAQYGVWVMLQFALALASLVANYHHNFAPQMYAVLVLPAYYVFHHWVGFGKIEEKLNSGNGALSSQECKKYLRLNVPLHQIYALLYALAAAWLVYATAGNF